MCAQSTYEDRLSAALRAEGPRIAVIAVNKERLEVPATPTADFFRPPGFTSGVFRPSVLVGSAMRFAQSHMIQSGSVSGTLKSLIVNNPATWPKLIVADRKYVLAGEDRTRQDIITRLAEMIISMDNHYLAGSPLAWRSATNAAIYLRAWNQVYDKPSGITDAQLLDSIQTSLSLGDAFRLSLDELPARLNDIAKPVGAAAGQVAGAFGAALGEGVGSAAAQFVTQATRSPVIRIALLLGTVAAGAIIYLRFGR